MLQSGLVSISFRELTTDQIIEIVKKANLYSIEWGGDIHLPPDNLLKAKRVYEKCKSNGILTPSYGSYYKLGTYKDYISHFKDVLNIALALNSKTIRIWAGIKSFQEYNQVELDTIIKEGKEICELANKHNISLSLEFHSNTITDSAINTLNIINLINKPNLFSYWQPPVNSIIEDNINDIIRLLPKISNIHVFNWENRNRLPLEKGYNAWKKYFSYLNDKDRYCMLEFIKDDSEAQFYKDAKILKELINE